MIWGESYKYLVDSREKKIDRKCCVNTIRLLMQLSLMPLCKYKRHRIHFIKEFIGAHNIKERPFSVENIV